MARDAVPGMAADHIQVGLRRLRRVYWPISQQTAGCNFVVARSLLDLDGASRYFFARPIVNRARQRAGEQCSDDRRDQWPAQTLGSICVHLSVIQIRNDFLL